MSRVLRRRLRHSALVRLKTGTAFTGVLFDYDRRALVLRNAEMLGMGERGEPVPVDGEVVMLWDTVEYCQPYAQPHALTP